jgi:MFS family permease
VEAVYFTLVAVALYFAADWVLDRIERELGRRLEHRTLVFFVILLSLALASFALIRRLSG